VRPWRINAISQGSRGKVCREGKVQDPRCSAGRFAVASESSSGSMKMRRGGMEGIMLDSRNVVRAKLKRTYYPVREAVWRNR
jgi:hypothetical protein